MITPREISEKTMNPEKRKEAKNDYFAFYIGRPLSYLLTIPFLYTKISPNTISLISIIPIIIGFLLMYTAKTKVGLMVGWLMFFFWNLLDGVDGNVARYKRQFSKLGSVFDAMSGYLSMLLSFFGCGIAAAHHPGVLQSTLNLPLDIYIILGALSGVFVIFPRLIMHKAITTTGDVKSQKNVQDKSGYSIIKQIALNLTSASGFVQVFILIAILINAMDFFTVCYFVINLLICIVSLKAILSDGGKGKRET